MSEPVSESNDTGLGLGSFLKKDAIEQPKMEKVDAKAETSPAQAEPVADAPKVEVKDTPTPSTDPKPTTNWDDDTNPWKKKASEFDQRFRDTQRSRSQLEQSNRELQRQMQVLQAKMDGTYDPRIHEPQPPDPETVRHLGNVEGKSMASFAAAARVHGPEKVMQILEQYGQIVQGDVAMQQRVLLSDDPVQAAMDVVKSHGFFTKYGNDPDKILDAVRKQILEEETPKIREAEAKRLQSELRSHNSEPRGIASVQGASGATDKSVAKGNAGRQKPLGSLFGH